MKDVYFLDKEELPTIPVPHDCPIKAILVEDQNMVFVFEDDLTGYDTFARIQPQAKSLVIRYHFTERVRDYSIYKWMKPNLLNKDGCFKCMADGFTNENQETLVKLTESTLEYIDHYVSAYSRSFLIQLFSSSKNEILIEADVDQIEFEWIL